MKICTFCNDNFPFEYQTVANHWKYWILVHDISPMRDFHCLLVYKTSTDERKCINDISNVQLPDEAILELGLALRHSAKSISESSDKISRVNIVSLNSGHNSNHLHFHIIPIHHDDHIKSPMSDINGGGFTFLSHLEITTDLQNKLINETTGTESKTLISSVLLSKKKRITDNVLILQRYFNRKGIC